MSQEVLQRFGKYFLLDRIGSGGMAGIFRARPASTDGNGRIVVIKRILPEMAKDPSFLSMFKSEIQICMAFNHPNIVQIYDFGESAKQSYLAMEYVDGKNLREIIIYYSRQNEQVPVQVAINVAIQAARGLHYAHTFQNTATGETLNLIHRDISPHNILLSYDGNVKIIDFGIAKAERRVSAETTQEGVIKGKVGYFSPEQIAGKELDCRSDIFALGIVFWELLTAQKLFGQVGKPDIEVIQLTLNCDVTVKVPSTFNPKVPPELDAIVMKCLTKDPEKRFQTAEELEQALEKFRGEFFPNATSSEVSKTVREIFKEEISHDREKLLELNQKAQIALSLARHHAAGFSGFSGSGVSMPSDLGKYDAIGATEHTVISYNSGSSRNKSRSHSHSVKRQQAAEQGLLENIPLVKKILTKERVCFFLFYLLTLLILRLDQQYMFFERLTMPNEYVKLMSEGQGQSHKVKHR